MSHNGYIVGSAASGAIAALNALNRSGYFDAYRTVDLINAGAHGAMVAAATMEANPTAARDRLIYAASRMLAAADRLADRRTPAPRPAADNVVILRASQ